jgi:hypothetical protein
MEAIRASGTSVHTRSTRRHIPEDGILHRITLYIQGTNSILKETRANTADWIHLTQVEDQYWTSVISLYRLVSQLEVNKLI